MKRCNKKGFTIVELVIVIAVIAILAAVLIPTIAGLVRKANISADTVLAKELNSAIARVAAEDEVDTFKDALAALKAHGYLIANLNAKADGCYFVWDDANKQIIFVDSKDNYKVLYSNKTASASKEDWYFAISDPAMVKTVRDAGYVNAQNTVATVEDLKAALAAGGEFYMDESLVLDNDNLLEINSAATINLGSSSLNTSGIVSGDGNYNEPIDIGANGNVIINGGNITAAGNALNLDNIKTNVTLIAKKGSTLVVNDTVFNNATYNSQMKLESTVTFNDVVINATKTAFDTRYGALVTLNNVTINMLDSNFEDTYGAWVWSCNSTHGTNAEDDAKVVINSGTYTRETPTNSKHAVTAGIICCGGDVEINGGTFTSKDTNYFGFHDNNGGEIVIKGGTFGNVAYKDLTIEILEGFCAGDYNVSGNVTDGFVITK